MNIKSLILGSAAALVAAPAMAADLPVAEPVDYVKVCDAYGAGYHYIPGTDTCLKINGHVEFEVYGGDYYAKGTPNRTTQDLVEMKTSTNVTFTAREETDLGTLTAVIELDSDGDNGNTGSTIALDKAYMQLGGFYAGIAGSLLDFNAGVSYDDHGIGFGDVNVIGYKGSLGNGVSYGIALEEYNKNVTATMQSAPAIVAQLGISQGWGSIVVGAGAYQVRYTNASVDTDLGYLIGGEASFNVAEGLTFGVAGGYDKGYKFVTAGTLLDMWEASVGATYAVSDALTVGVDGGISNYTDEDYKEWTVSGKFDYKVVNNLTLTGKVGYKKYDSKTAGADYDGWVGKVVLKRSF